MTTELIIFDCDGVLIDSELIACRVDADYLQEIGIPITAEEIRDRYVGVSTATMLADLEARHKRRLPAGLTEELRLRVAAAFETELTAMPGIEDVLAWLTCRRCVASSSSPERLRHSLSLVGLWPSFDPHVFSATQVANGKPAPDLFLYAAARMGTAPGTCLVVEDSVAGVQAASSAGMRVLGFTGGSHCGSGHAGRLQEAGAAETFADLRRLPALV